MAVGTGRFYVLAAVLKLNSVKEKNILIVDQLLMEIDV